MMIKNLFSLFFVSLFLSCSTDNSTSKIESTKQKDTALIIIEKKDTVTKVIAEPNAFVVNDSLNALANIISGIKDDYSNFNFVQNSSDFKVFSKNFDKRWNNYDSTRITHLKKFKENEISKVVIPQTTLFYPFSGPDILHAQTFFPEADKYVMIGLEPVGSLPVFLKDETDSLENYFQKINTSLNAILKFSFFRTQSMKSDLKNEEVDGVIHLLCLFLKRTGNNLSSIKAISVDSVGNVLYVNSFEKLKTMKTNTRGVEIKFNDQFNKPKTLCYFSLNAADGGLKSNKNFTKYLSNLGMVNTYLKGASYLMHKDYFSIIRNIIFNQSEHIIQDDSGIAFHYFLNDKNKWKYNFYGQYLKPIPMFAQHYQKDLDSLYKIQGATPIGFGIGYNFKDKNSNFMIATKMK